MPMYVKTGGQWKNIHPAVKQSGFKNFKKVYVKQAGRYVCIYDRDLHPANIVMQTTGPVKISIMAVPGASPAVPATLVYGYVGGAQYTQNFSGNRTTGSEISYLELSSPGLIYARVVPQSGDPTEQIVNLEISPVTSGTGTCTVIDLPRQNTLPGLRHFSKITISTGLKYFKYIGSGYNSHRKVLLSATTVELKNTPDLFSQLTQLRMGVTGIKNLIGFTNLDFSAANNMQQMFSSCEGTIDMRGWKLPKKCNYSGMFRSHVGSILGIEGFPVGELLGTDLGDFLRGADISPPITLVEWCAPLIETIPSNFASSARGITQMPYWKTCGPILTGTKPITLYNFNGVTSGNINNNITVDLVLPAGVTWANLDSLYVELHYDDSKQDKTHPSDDMAFGEMGIIVHFANGASEEFILTTDYSKDNVTGHMYVSVMGQAAKALPSVTYYNTFSNRANNPIVKIQYRKLTRVWYNYVYTFSAFPTNMHIKYRL